MVKMLDGQNARWPKFLMAKMLEGGVMMEFKEVWWSSG